MVLIFGTICNCPFVCFVDILDIVDVEAIFLGTPAANKRYFLTGKITAYKTMTQSTNNT
jgi:hypothetical protein